MSGELHPIRVRAHVEPTKATQPARAARPHPRALLVHLLADPAEHLSAAASAELELPAIATERLFLPTNTTEEAVESWARWASMTQHSAWAAPLAVDKVGALSRLIVSRCYRHRVPLLGWDLPWTLGRMAGHVGRADPNGFSITLADLGREVDGKWLDHSDHPRITMRPRPGQLGAFLAWGAPRDTAYRYRGKRRATFIDLSVLASALAGRELGSPQIACDTFGVTWPSSPNEEPERLVAETEALSNLYVVLLGALAQVAPGLRPEQAWSAGSIAAWSLTRAKVSAPEDKSEGIDLATKGAMASAFHGGRVEAPLVGVCLPMASVDVNSTYPAMFSLLGLSLAYACERFEAEAVDPEELRSSLASRAWRSDRDQWRCWGLAFVTIVPRGEPLPATVEWKPGWVGSTVAPLDLAGGALTYHWADLAAAVEEGADPAGFEVVRAWRLVPQGVCPGLRALRLPTGTRVDLATQDLGAILVAERERVKSTSERPWLGGLVKLYGNSLTFGGLARMDRKFTTRPQAQVAYGPAGEELRRATRHPEEPGPFTCMAMAVSVCAGARLVMAMAKRTVTDAGGVVAHMNTDSLAVPASPDGGFATCPGAEEGKVRLLSLDTLADIVGRFEALGVSWKFEASTGTGVTTGLVVGTNKVILVRGGEVVRSADTDLGGYLLDPTGTRAGRPDGRWGWAAELEGAIVAANSEGAVTLGPGVEGTYLDYSLRTGELAPWAENLALRRFRATSWSALRHLRASLGDPTVGPYASYLRAETARPAPVALGRGDDPAGWRILDWRSQARPARLEVYDYEADCVRLVGGQTSGRGFMARTVAGHLDRWLGGSDPSMTGPDRGLRSPVEVYSSAATVRVVGRGGELACDEEDPETRAGDLASSYGLSPRAIEELRRQVALVGLREVERLSGVPEQTLSDWLRGAAPSQEIIVAVARGLTVEVAPRYCQGRHDEPVILTGRQRSWCSHACRLRAERAKAAETAAARVGMAICPGCGAFMAGRPRPLCRACQDKVGQVRKPVWRGECQSCGAEMTGRPATTCLVCRRNQPTILPAEMSTP